MQKLKEKVKAFSKLKIKKKKKSVSNVLRVLTANTILLAPELQDYIYTGEVISEPVAAFRHHVVENFLQDKCPSFHLDSASKFCTVSEKDAMGFMANFDTYITDYCTAYRKSKGEALMDIQDYIGERTLLIRPSGVASFLNRAAVSAQASFSAIHVVYSSSASHLTGIVGVKLLSASPMLIVTLPTIGGIFFVGCERLVPNTLVGEACGACGRILLLPMRGVEMVANNAIINPIASLLNTTTAMNLTNIITQGEGFNISQYNKLSGAFGSRLRETFSAIKKIWG